jgi:hypothetical protein
MKRLPFGLEEGLDCDIGGYVMSVGNTKTQRHKGTKESGFKKNFDRGFPLCPCVFVSWFHIGLT